MIFCYLCIHSFAWIHSLFVRVQLEQFCATCYTQQQYAYTYKKNVTIFCNQEQNQFVLENQTFPLAGHVQFGTIPGVKGPPSNPTKNITNPVSFKNNTITCFANGGISSGTIYLKDTREQKTYALSNAVGSYPFLRLYQYIGKWRQL